MEAERDRRRPFRGLHRRGQDLSPGVVPGGGRTVVDAACIQRQRPLRKESTVNEKRVGIWIRVSTEDQAKGESPEHHEKRGRFYAESKDWRVREVYHLEAVSGKSVRDHPETQRMLGDVKRGHISGLIFSKLARLARNTRELLEFADLFEDAGADLV